jgi:hypothetical protein
MRCHCAKLMSRGRAHPPLAVIDRVDDIGDALPAPVGGLEAGQEHHRHAADQRRENHERTQPARRRVYVRVVIEREFAEEKEIVNGGDHGAEGDAGEAGGNAKRQRHRRKLGERRNAPFRRGHGFVPHDRSIPARPSAPDFVG